MADVRLVQTFGGRDLRDRCGLTVIQQALPVVRKPKRAQRRGFLLSVPRFTSVHGMKVSSLTPPAGCGIAFVIGVLMIRPWPNVALMGPP